MLDLQLSRLFGALAICAACASVLVASCTTPKFSFADNGSAPPPHCQDLQRNEGESDVDCGGACTPCALSQACNQGSDCQTGVCGGQGCAAPSCDDRVKNGAESDVDCGGPDCSSCIAGQSCVTPSDCVGNTCTSGVCVLTCASGLGNCDGDAANACETNLRADADHCGDCGTSCALPNAQANCASGVCRVQSCVPPFDDCNGDPADGCEVNTKTDVTNCGACAAKPCPTLNGQAYCESASCGITCSADFADCDGEAGNGCEKAVSRDVHNCGGCGKECTASAGKTAWCRAGQCGETPCAVGRGDCNGDPDDDPAHGGCETDFKTDVDSCGSCGNPCQVNGGDAQCLAGVCAILSCHAGLADCAGGYADGCETNTNTDLANCGSCTKVCATPGGTPSCTAGVCGKKSCSGTFEDCNGVVGDGCEANTATSAGNCGGCGTVCSSSASAHVLSNNCSASACKPICAALYKDCDAMPGNGCERSVASDTGNCGGCGVSCGTAHTTSTSCAGGACTPSCQTGWKNCGSAQAGCNVQLGTTANCSTCGEACAGATPYCTASGCSGHLDISVVGAGSSAQGSFDTSAIPVLTLTHTLGNPSGNSRLVLVGVTAAEPYLSTESVKYNGTTMTLAVQTQTAEGHSYAGIFYLLDSALPANAGSYPVSVTFRNDMYAGVGAFNVLELKNVAQTGSLVTNAVNPLDADCSSQGDRSVTLSFAQAGSFGYAVTAARMGSNATPNPGVLLQTMNLNPTNPWSLVGVAGYAGPISGNTTLTWNIANCWNSASAAVALKRVGN